MKSWSHFLVLIPALFIIFTPLFNHRGNHILFYVFNNPITLEAIIQGVINGLSLLAIITVFITFNLVITPDKFLFLFSKWFPQWALLIILSIRFVPLLRRRMGEIISIQRTRGYSVSEGKLKQKLQNGILLLQTLLTWSLEDGIQTADSMAARGYGLQKRSKYMPYKMTKIDYGYSVIFLILFGIGIFGWWLGDGVLSLLPYLEPIILYGREWLFFAFYIIMIGFPIIIELKETLQWQYWLQKR